MADQLFRQKSIDRVSSPEQLHDYMRVTNPRLWMVLVTILVLLVGLIVFAASTRIEDTMAIEVNVYDGIILAELDEKEGDRIRVGMPVRIGEQEGKVIELYQDRSGFMISVELNDPNAELKDGSYEGEVVTGATTPISFLLN